MRKCLGSEVLQAPCCRVCEVYLYCTVEASIFYSERIDCSLACLWQALEQSRTPVHIHLSSAASQSCALKVCIRTDSFPTLSPTKLDAQHALPQLFREFTGASLHSLEGIQKYFKLVSFEKGEVIFSIGQESNCFYIVLEGEAIVYLVDPHEYKFCSVHSVEGKVMHRVRRGCFFGKLLF